MGEDASEGLRDEYGSEGEDGSEGEVEVRVKWE